MRSDMDGQPSNDRELTYGEKAVGLTFNPSGDPQVHLIKAAYASIIDQLNDFRNSRISEALKDSSERNRLASVAITSAQEAQMWAVKALTWKY